MNADKPPKVFLVCSGLGHINRGFESFTQECFEALSTCAELDVILFKGGGGSKKKEIALWNLPRNRALSETLGKWTRKSGYILEQATFGLSLLPHIIREQPDVIFLSDFCLGHYLWHWRKRTNSHYKLLFSNGGPTLPPFPHWDHVHQVAPAHLQDALDTGEPREKQTMIPYGVQMEPELRLLSPEEKVSLRKSLGLPTDRPIVLSVGIVNNSYKRMDYVIREVASLNGLRPYLIMLGQQDEETPGVQRLADKLLGADNFQIHMVPHQEIQGYFQAADAFVLASLGEGFGRVFLEALSYGVPCIAHDYSLPQYILGKSGLLADFRQEGSLSQLICQVLEQNDALPPVRLRHKIAFERFSWQHLRPQYVEMIQRCLM